MTETRPGSTGPGHTNHTVQDLYQVSSPGHINHTVQDLYQAHTIPLLELHWLRPQQCITNWHDHIRPYFTHHTPTGNNTKCTILPCNTTGRRRVECTREDAQDGVAGCWCTIWCCTREQSQASHHPVITVPHYTRHPYCNIGV